jgi:hypothetical protein
VADHPHLPDRLKPHQLAQLEEHVQSGQFVAPELLLQSAYAYLEDVQSLARQRPDIHAELAEQICHVLDRIVSEWESFSPVEQSWLRGMMRYFSKSNDQRHDFQLDGFTDDVEILNACLCFVHREPWQLAGGKE